MDTRKRPAIARRSCDQCRARKIACDRESPCSNCASAKLSCAHSAIATQTSPPRQRILISAQYEQKIDGIAKDVDGIKNLLKTLDIRTQEKLHEVSAFALSNRVESAGPIEEHDDSSASRTTPLWDHSAHIVDFLRVVVSDNGLRSVGTEAGQVLSSLKALLNALESPRGVPSMPIVGTKTSNGHSSPSMPPLKAVVAVLRWVKDYETNIRIAWISQILPLEKWNEVCQRVYFAIDDYSEIDLILANGYLSYIFFEHIVVSGRQDYGEYCCMCRKNLHDLLLRLPLLLPANMQIIAALTLGTCHAIENSRVTMAWTFISAASQLCQTLGYHRRPPRLRNDETMQRAAQDRLWWTVYRMDKGLSLRLGRGSTIRDAEITLPPTPEESHATRLARIQSRAYDQLYSPSGLSQTDEERGRLAEVLAQELRVLISETDVSISQSSAPGQTLYSEADPLRAIYLQCDQTCQTSLLCLILRAIPAVTPGSHLDLSDECVAVARSTIEIQEGCMAAIRNCNPDLFMLTRYISWAILHCPFVSFSILFTYTIQTRDTSELARLNRFADSLQPQLLSQSKSPDLLDSETHPCRLYKLLCQAAQLYIDSSTSSLFPNFSTTADTIDPTSVIGATNQATHSGPSDGFGTMMSHTTGIDRNLTPDSDWLGEWYYGHQQLMGLLDDSMTF